MAGHNLRSLPVPDRLRQKFHLSHRQAAIRAGVPYNTYLRAVDPSNGEKPTLDTVARIVAASGGYFTFEDFLSPETRKSLPRLRGVFKLPPEPSTVRVGRPRKTA